MCIYILHVFFCLIATLKITEKFRYLEAHFTIKRINISFFINANLKFITKCPIRDRRLSFK